MLSEIIRIKNVGPIVDAEIVLRDVNILIGDQGTGKSTLAKLIIAIQSTVLREIWTFEWANKNLNTKTESFKEYLRITGIDTYISSATEIYLESELMTFVYKNDNVEQIIKKNKKLNSTLDYDFNYIPAERSYIINFAKNLYALIETGTQLPGIFTRFGDKFLKARDSSLIFDYQHIIGIKYSYRDKDTDIVFLQDGKEILLSNASTALQASIPMLVVFDRVVRNSKKEINDFKKIIIIEEPELNCFPETQYKLMKHFISNLIYRDGETIGYKNQLLLTTHSPYILTSLNNLMEAYKTGQLKNKETDEIIEDKYWINPNDVSAYMMLSNGTCEDIFDREEGLIKAEKIDSVSNVLNEQFSSLLNLEFSENEFDTK